MPAPDIQWSAQNAARTPRAQPGLRARHDVVDAVFTGLLQYCAWKSGAPNTSTFSREVGAGSRKHTTSKQKEPVGR
jgi:hypothetical protein